MKFLVPIAFTAFAVLPLIALFYLLKLKRDDHVVSSTMLWRKSVDNLRANSPFEKLRANLLFFLQLLLAALLAFALTRPLMNLRPKEGVSRVLLIDVSASMAATDAEGGSRLEAAKRLSRRLIDEMTLGDQMALIAFSNTSEALTPFTGDHARLNDLIDDLSVRATSTDIADAMSLGLSLLRNRKAKEVIVISDGRFPPMGDLATDGARVECVTVGKSRFNVAVTAIDARTDYGDSRQTQLFAVARNFSDVEIDTGIDLIHDDRIVDTRRVTLAPGAEELALFEDVGDASGRLEIRLDIEDDLPLDNVAYCVLSPRQKTRVLLLTKGNIFLESALRQDLDIELKTAALSSIQSDEDWDLLIFDGAAPSDLRQGVYWFINCLPPLPGFERVGDGEPAEVFDWINDHPLTRFVQFSGVALGGALNIKTPDDCEVVVESRNGPLLLLHSLKGRQSLVQTFDFYDSNLPHRVAFPILVTNILNWARRQSASNGSVAHRGGDVIPLPNPGNAKRLIVQGPDGEGFETRLNASGGALFGQTFTCGYYTALADGREVGDIGVSLLNADESDITPRRMTSIAGAPATTSTTETRKTNREIWPWLIGAALALLMLEWLIYHRRIWV